jgi:hypothetical protein
MITTALRSLSPVSFETDTTGDRPIVLWINKNLLNYLNIDVNICVYQ